MEAPLPPSLQQAAWGRVRRQARDAGSAARLSRPPASQPASQSLFQRTGAHNEKESGENQGNGGRIKGHGEGNRVTLTMAWHAVA